MNKIISAAVIAIALGVSAVSVQAGSGYSDAVSKGQVIHPNGTAGTK